MTNLTESEQAAICRMAAGIRKTYFGKHYDLSADQVIGLSKWLNASLLAINGAAVVAILNKSDHLKISIFAFSLFIIGIMLPILSGWTLQLIYNNLTEPSFNFFIYWSEVEITGERNLETEEILQKNSAKAMRFQLAAPALGWLSAAAFVAGIVMTARSLR